MAKVIDFLLSFLVSPLQGLLNSSLLFLADELIARSQKAFQILMTSFITSVLFIAGIIISILEASTQYDNSGYLSFSATFLSGILLSLVSLLVLFAILRPLQKENKVKTQEIPMTALDIALSSLAMEAVNYLKEIREDRVSSKVNAQHSKKYPYSTSEADGNGKDTKFNRYDETSAN